MPYFNDTPDRRCRFGCISSRWLGESDFNVGILGPRTKKTAVGVRCLKGPTAFTAPRQTKQSCANRYGTPRSIRDGLLDLVVNSKNVNFLCGLGRPTQGRWTFRDEGAVTSLIIGGHGTKPKILDADSDCRSELLLGAEHGCLYITLQQARQS